MAYSLMGRNPLCQSGQALAWADEWKSVQGLLKSLEHKPERLEQDSAGNARWSTVLGDLWVPPGSDSHYVGMLSSEISSNVYHVAGKGRQLKDAYVLDAGANVGVFSRFALQQGAKLVVAFEPSPATAECLRRNLAPEIASGRAVVIEKGLWNRATTLSFSAGNKNNPGSHHVVEDAADADFQITVTTVDAVVADLNMPRVDYIKMDIEGAEVAALRGAAETIRQHQPTCTIATEHTSDLFANNKAVIQTMRELDGRYEYVCTEAHVYDSPSGGRVLVPYTLFFSCSAPRPA